MGSDQVKAYMNSVKPGRPGPSPKITAAAADDVFDLRDRGYKLRQIREFLKQFYGIDVSEVAIGNFLKSKKSGRK